MNNSRFSTLLPIVISVSICLGFVLCYAIMGDFFDAQKKTKGIQKLEDVLNLLDDKYVDAIDRDQIFEEAIAEMLHKLDPHSNYIPAREMAKMSESIEGNFSGIGVRFFKLRDTINVTHVISNTPSERAGLKDGDQIVQIEKTNAAGVRLSTDSIMLLLKGKSGTAVNVIVNREGNLIPFKIIRGRVPITSVNAAYMVDEKTGYIKIDQFSVPTSYEFRLEAISLLNQGMKSLILDLRNNGGGVLQSATDIADEFLRNGLSIVTTKGRKIGTKEYIASQQGVLENINLAVLINSRSASASEIVAGAIQDNDRGIIVGRRSFGKGLVQEDQKLRDGSSVRITIARYYTPSGRCIQRPYSDKDYEEYYDNHSSTDESLFKLDSSMYVDSLRYFTSEGRSVYGGGGISPDVFVPLDTTNTGMYYSSILWGGGVNQYAYDYVKSNGLFSSNKWGSLNQFKSDFIVDEDMVNAFVNYTATELGILPYSMDEVNRCRQKIEVQIKSEVARQIWQENGFYSVYNSFDKEFKAALEALK